MRAGSSYFFEEGQIYPFLITGEVGLPPDNEAFFILQSKFNSKHLMKKQPFVRYNLLVGETINCRIDKINCSGKIFLEPEHPFYKEGRIYEFPIVRKKNIVNSLFNTETLLILKDCWNREVFVNSTIDGGKSTKTHVACRVERIKKGKLYLTIVDGQPETPELEAGKVYPFVVKDIVTLTDKDEYYRLEDEQGFIHFLRRKYFADYGFGAGDTISCRVIGSSLRFRHYLEPLHPKYTIGEAYDFLLSGTENHTNEFGKNITLLIVNDGSEKEYFADCPDTGKADMQVGSKIKCTVTDIRMSRLRLKCI